MSKAASSKTHNIIATPTTSILTLPIVYQEALLPALLLVQRSRKRKEDDATSTTTRSKFSTLPIIIAARTTTTVHQGGSNDDAEAPAAVSSSSSPFPSASSFQGFHVHFATLDDEEQEGDRNALPIVAASSINSGSTTATAALILQEEAQSYLPAGVEALRLVEESTHHQSQSETQGDIITVARCRPGATPGVKQVELLRLAIVWEAAAPSTAAESTMAMVAVRCLVPHRASLEEILEKAVLVPSSSSSSSCSSSYRALHPFLPPPLVPTIPEAQRAGGTAITTWVYCPCSLPPASANAPTEKRRVVVIADDDGDEGYKQQQPPHLSLLTSLWKEEMRRRYIGPVRETKQSTDAAKIIRNVPLRKRVPAQAITSSSSPVAQNQNFPFDLLVPVEMSDGEARVAVEKTLGLRLLFPQQQQQKDIAWSQPLKKGERATDDANGQQLGQLHHPQTNRQKKPMSASLLTFALRVCVVVLVVAVIILLSKRLRG